MSLTEKLRAKAQLKRNFTNSRRQLIANIYDLDKEEIKQRLDNLVEASDECLKHMLELSKDQMEEDALKTLTELERLEDKYNEAITTASAVLEEMSRRPSRASPRSSSPTSVDRAKKLKEVRQCFSSVNGQRQSLATVLSECEDEDDDDDDVEDADMNVCSGVPKTDGMGEMLTKNLSVAMATETQPLATPQQPSSTTSVEPGTASAPFTTLPDIVKAPAQPTVQTPITAAPDLTFRLKTENPTDSTAFSKTTISPVVSTPRTNTAMGAHRGMGTTPALSNVSAASSSVVSSSVASSSVASSSVVASSVASSSVASSSVVSSSVASSSVASSAGVSAQSVRYRQTTANVAASMPLRSSSSQQQFQSLPPQQYQRPVQASSGYLYAQQGGSSTQSQYAPQQSLQSSQAMYSPQSYQQQQPSLPSYYQQPQQLPLYNQQQQQLQSSQYYPSYGQTTVSQPYDPSMYSSQYLPAQSPAVATSSSVPAKSTLSVKKSDIDALRHVKAITIPVFTGDKRSFASWKAAFMASIGDTVASDQLKMLQLRQYLKGEPLETIDSLGFSAAAYVVAWKRLDKKYGGERRQLAMHMADIEKSPIVRGGHPDELQKFVDLLEIITVAFHEHGKHNELGDGVLLMQLQAKLNPALLTQYNRWRHEWAKMNSVSTLAEFITQEAEYATEAAEAIHGIGELPSNRRPQRSRSTYMTQDSPRAPHPKKPSQQQPKQQCQACKSATHHLGACAEFRKLATRQRWQMVRQEKLCFRCLGAGHRCETCPEGTKCAIDSCTGQHHRLLHFEKSAAPPNQTSLLTQAGLDKIETGPTTVLATAGKTKASETLFTRRSKATPVALRTLPVMLVNGDKRLMVNAVLDDASTQTYLDAGVAAQLGLEGPAEEIRVSVVNGREEVLETSHVECVVGNASGDFSTTLAALTLDGVTGSLQAHDWRARKIHYEHLRDLPLPAIASGPVQVLIGMDHSDLHVSLEEVTGDPGDPVARRTPLGWTCVGPATAGTRGEVSSFFINEIEMNYAIRRLWDLEHETTNQPIMSVQEAEVLAETRKSITFSGGRYQVGVPWRRQPGMAEHSYDMAVRRLRSAEKRLQRMPEVMETYNETLRQHIEKGYVEEVRNLNLSEPGWFLPHFAVIRPGAATTKVRVVFDAAAKVHGASLNDHIHAGPKLQRDLVDILLRFRKNPVAIVADIAEMYLQIHIPEEDRCFHRFVWRETMDDPPKAYEYTRVVFGVNASPFLAQLVSQEHARKHQIEYPRAAETILKSTYMDDSMDSEEDEPKAVKLYKQLSILWEKAGMHPRKWISNSIEVLSLIPESDRAKDVDITNGELPMTKALGVQWKADEDILTFTSTIASSSEPMTKRIFLKKLAALFDPLGLVGPFIIRGRILLQQLWLEGLEWDGPVPDALGCAIDQWLSEISVLTGVEVPRCLRPSPATVTSTQLHVFVDASMEAYGAVAYLRCEFESGDVTCRLVCGKGKVAPLSAVSIPRLELMGAVVGSRLAVSVSEALSLDSSTISYWTDSTNVLWWISNRSRSFKPFVANRVAEIHSLSEPSQWKHVPTASNPADCLSRGVKAAELLPNKQWWEGPSFLVQGTDEWPPQPKATKPAVPEIRAAAQESCFLTFMSTIDTADWRLAPERFSSWRKLVRQTALVMRFAYNCRVGKESRQVGPLSTEELSEAESAIIRAEQRKYFPEYEILRKGKPLPADSKLSPFCPFLDESGVARVQGRLDHAEYLPFDARHPVLLPRKSWVSMLIVRLYHEDGKHAMGVNHVYAALMTKYWVVSGRELVRECEKVCTVCQRNKAKPGSQLMAPLPKARVTMPLQAFSRVAVDYAGPFITIQGRGTRRAKRYLCLFTCLTTRAVHLEMAYSLDTDSFINAFQRMVNRRGSPEEVISDNGTNFVGGERDLRELMSQSSQTRIVDQTSHQRVKWSFNPPAGPHFGGVHEIMVKAAKKAIYAILGSADITDEELVTALTGAESLMNSRPLLTAPSDVRDELPLTPNHFLAGRMVHQLVPSSAELNLRKRWQRIQELIEHFWRRWMQEWLPLMNQRSKWRTAQDDFKEGDVVLIVSTDTPRGKWPLGRIVAVYPGHDSHVRVAKVQIGKKTLTRPITRLCRFMLQH